MEQLNPRSARSRNALRNALLTLWRERDFYEISVTEVTRAAGVGYTTFYRHYANQGDLLLDLLQTNADNLTDRLRQETTLYDESVAFYTFIRDNEDLIRLYLRLPERHPARHAARSTFCAFIAQRYAARACIDVPFDLTINHIIEATHQVIFFYLERLDYYTPEDIAKIHIQLVVQPTVNATLEVRDDWQEHHSILQPT